MHFSHGWAADLGPWMQVCYDPVSATLLATSAITGGTALYGKKKQDAANKKMAASLAMPALQPSPEAPTENSFDIANEAQRQLDALGGRGRDSTNLTKRKKKKEVSLDGDGGDIAPSYTNTSLG